MSQPNEKKFFIDPKLQFPKLWRAALCCSLLMALIFQSGVYDDFDFGIIKRWEFLLRDSLNLNPRISKRLKIVAYDDRAVFEFDREKLTHEQWVEILRDITQRNPKRILIDRRFADSLENEGIQLELNQALQESKRVVAATALYSESFLKRKSLKTESLIPLDSERFDSKLTIDRDNPGAERLFAAGPNPAIMESFYRIGIKNYFKHGLVNAYSTDASGRRIHNFALYAGDQITKSAEYLIVDGQKIRLIDQKHIMPNFVEMKRFGKSGQIASVTKFFKDDGFAGRFIQPNDLVLIIPGFYTSGADFKTTPVGKMPGGLIAAAIINQIITQQHLELVEGFNLVAAILAIIFALIVFIWSGDAGDFILMGIGVAVLAVAVGFACFALANASVPWFPFVSSYSLMSGVLLFLQYRQSEQRRLSLVNSLRDKFSPSLLGKILSHKSNVETEASSRCVSILFIDIVGYSKFAEDVVADLVFIRLKSIMREVVGIIHRHDGVINNAYGDGLLAVFGYQFDGLASISGHEKQAVSCAIDLQKYSFEMSAQELRNDSNASIHPFRIGVNSGDVAIGNLGSFDALSFTLIGHTVNFSKRLEEACEIGRVMIGPTTYAGIARQEPHLKKIIHARPIIMKHHLDVIDAYEVSPYADEVVKKIDIKQRYLDSVGIKPKESRRTLPHSMDVQVSSVYGNAQLIDYSLGGLSLRFGNYLARKIDK